MSKDKFGGFYVSGIAFFIKEWYNIRNMIKVYYMEIRFDKRAKKFIETQDSSTKQRLRKGIEGLAQKPPVGDIKTLQGYSDGRLRLRVGKFRIIFRYTSDGQIEILQIMDIDSRGDIYKHS